MRKLDFQDRTEEGKTSTELLRPFKKTRISKGQGSYLSRIAELPEDGKIDKKLKIFPTSLFFVNLF